MLLNLINLLFFPEIKFFLKSPVIPTKIANLLVQIILQ